MLSAVAFAWGILATIGMLLGFLPCLAGVSWLNLPFAVLGAITGIVSFFSQRDGGSRAGIIGTALCMLASIVGILRLVVESSGT